MILRNQEEPMGFGEWIRTLLLLCVPLLGLGLLIYWAVSSEGKASRRNFARANLCITGVILVGAVGLAVFSAQALPHLRERLAAAAPQNEGSTIPDGSPGTATESALAPAKSAAAAPAAPANTAPRPPTIISPEEPARTFRATDGRTMEAKVISLTDDQVTIRRTDGREFTADITRFSADDVAYFMRLRNGGGVFD